MKFIMTYESFTPRIAERQKRMLDQVKGTVLLVYDKKLKISQEILTFWSPSGSKTLSEEIKRSIKGSYNFEFDQLSVEVRPVSGYFWVLTYDATEDEMSNIELDFYNDKKDYDEAVNKAEFLSTMGSYSGDHGQLSDMIKID